MNIESLSCPKCNHPNHKDNKECDNCGLIFAKYAKKRDIDFNDALMKFYESENSDIESHLIQLAVKYPDISEECYKIISVFENALIAESSSRFDKAIDIYRTLKTDYPQLSKESDRRISDIKQNIKFKSAFNKGVKAYKDDRYFDAKVIFSKLKSEYPDNPDIDQYLEEISRYVNGGDHTPSEVEDENIARCPKCRSSSIITLKKGYAAGSGCCGAILLGPLGLLCGASGSNIPYNVCQNCGHKWKVR